MTRAVTTAWRWPPSGHSEEALGHLQAAVHHGPATLEARRQLGLCLVQQEQYAEAERWLLQVAQVQPEDQQSSAALALVFEKQGKTAQAAAASRDLGIALLKRSEVGPARE